MRHFGRRFRVMIVSVGNVEWEARERCIRHWL